MLTSQQLLDEYIQQWEEKHGSGMVHTKEAWDVRAVEWAKEDDSNDPMTRVRIDACVDALNRHHLLDGDRDVIDIGCGPCRFVSEFAKTAHHVTGTDLSPKMLEFGAEFCHKQGHYNTSFTPCNFKTVSVAEMGWEKKFDLVFSSMTPAVSEYSCIERMFQMSRGWICNCTCVMSSRKLDNDIAEILGIEATRPAWDGKWFQAMFNIAWLRGHFPEATYFPLDHSSDRHLTREGILDDLHHLCRENMPDEAKITEVYEELLRRSDNGVYHDESRNLYGIVMWDTNLKARRG